ncbi:MAG TPA: DUF2917 domain-containing protein [Burkholderiales bacterium]|nr:DUF2917 domain-containing protein [Burkholderiales bacterium]
MNIAIARNRIPVPSFARAQIAGRLSIVERGTLSLTAMTGLTVHVRAGSIWIAHAPDERSQRLRAGESFAARRDGCLVLHAESRNEIEIDWPEPATERLSPGLESLTLAL